MVVTANKWEGRHLEATPTRNANLVIRASPRATIFSIHLTQIRNFITRGWPSLIRLPSSLRSSIGNSTREGKILATKTFSAKILSLKCRRGAAEIVQVNSEGARISTAAVEVQTGKALHMISFTSRKACPPRRLIVATSWTMSATLNLRRCSTRSSQKV